MSKKKKQFIFVMLPHLMIIEDGSIITDRYTNYDSKNIDIEFDYSSKELKKKLKNNFLNIHEGMDYEVVFKLKDAGSLGRLTGELESFIPAILDKLP